jgi:hypothetical protein
MDSRLDLEFFLSILSISGSSRSLDSSRLEGDAAGDTSRGISPLLPLGANADRFLSSSKGLGGGGAILTGADVLPRALTR